MLANIVIINPTWADLVSQTNLFRGVVEMIVRLLYFVELLTWSRLKLRMEDVTINTQQTNMFLLLTMEIFSDDFSM